MIKKRLIMPFVILMASVLLFSGIASAHTDPAGATATGVTISLTAFRADGATPVLPGSVTECETIYYRATLRWAGGNNASFERGTWTITTPDGTVHNVTPSPFLPCIGDSANSTDDPNSATNDGRGLCAGTPGTVDSALVLYTVRPQDITMAGTIIARTDLTGAFAHIGANDTPGVTAGTPFTLVVQRCNDNLFCNGVETCDPTIVHGELDERLGQCVPGVPINCDDGNACTTEICDEALDRCVTTSTVVCNDSNACTSDRCVPETGQCEYSTTVVCNDGNACTSDRCVPETGQCEYSAPRVCSEDPNVPDVCEYCDQADGECKIDLTRNPICQREETCRTPGFWATHAGTEKARSNNITQKVIDSATGCIEICGEIIDDTNLNSADSAVEAMCVRVQGNSRLQLVRQLTAAALNCVVSGGGSDCTGISIENVFQECNSTCATPRSPAGSLTINQCIFKLDCFNNGGQVIDINGTPYCQTGACSDNQAPCKEKDLSRCGAPLTATCTPLEGNCHDMPLGVCANGTICTETETYISMDGKRRCIADNSLCVPGPAGSSTKCNAANANACTVIRPGEGSCETGNKTNPGLEYCD